MNGQEKEIQQRLTGAGYRLTPARQAIISTLVTCAGHITADELAIKVRQSTPHVGRMTVYRTLDLLSELGVIRPIYQGTGAAHYILMAGGSHHHFICNSCHNVIEFEDCAAGDLAKKLASRFNLKISSHLLELHGLCADCQ